MRWFFLLLLLLFSVGCAPERKEKKVPEQILSLSCAATKILYDLESPPAAIDEYGLIAAGSPAPQVIGKGSLVSREKMAELGIDCVVLWYYQKDAAELFRKKGLRVIELQPVRLKEYPSLLQIMGDLTGKQEKAFSLQQRFLKELESLSPSGKEKKVYFELYGPMQSVGRESYTGDLLSYSGGTVLSEKTGLVSIENLLSFQPEIIFYVEGYGSGEMIRNRPGFSNLPAVKNGRIYGVPRRLITEGVAPLEAIQFFRKILSEE